MANPTTNFGWVMPTSSSLVTNLPADFNTFGQAVDTSMSELLGGTTGQVLSKTSNTNMDFTWVTPTDQTPLTTKGDLFTFTTVDARLAVGNNGETLVADSSTSTGLRYQVAKSVNHVINGGMDIWQRGTSFVSSASLQYTTDRFQFLRAGSVAGGTLSRQNTNDTTNLPNIQYCARVQRDSGNTSTAVTYFASTLESQETRQLQGQAVVLSFYARAGANYSAASSILAVEIISGTGTDQNIFSGFTGQASVASNKTLTTTWQRFTATATVPSTATQLCVLFPFTPVGTAGANDYYEITGVQLELGTVPTPFQRSGGTLQGELAACQRYYWRSPFESTYTILGTGSAYSTANSRIFIPLLVQMRTQPSTLDYGGTTPFALYDGTNVIGPFAGTGLTLENGFLSSSKGAALTVVPGGTPLTAFRPYFLIFNGSGNTSQYIGFGAEL